MIGRDEMMQVFILLWVLAGTLGNYVMLKVSNKNPVTITAISKKVIIGIIAAGILLGTQWYMLRGMGHTEVIIPSITWGISAEMVVGRFIQQKLESFKK